MTLKAPRKPLSAYNFFFQEERAKLLGEETIANEHSDPKERKKRCHRRTHGKIGFTQLAKHVGQKWKSLDKESKKVYQEKFQQDKLRYAKELEKYEDDLSNMIHLAQVKKALKTLKQEQAKKEKEITIPDVSESNSSVCRQDCYFNDVLDAAVSISIPSMMEPSVGNFQFQPLNNFGAVPAPIFNAPMSLQDAQMRLQMLQQEEQIVRMRLQIYEYNMSMNQQQMLNQKQTQPPMKQASTNAHEEHSLKVQQQEKQTDQEQTENDSFEKMLDQLHDVNDTPMERSSTPVGLPDLDTSLNLEWGAGDLETSLKLSTLDTDLELLNFDFDDCLQDGFLKPQDELNLDFLRDSIYN